MRKILIFCLIFVFHPVAVSNTYYDILSVSPNASQKNIKHAYQRMMAEFHPDRNKDPDATKRSQEINEAYDTLSNPKRRAEYDKKIDSEYTFAQLFQLFRIAERALVYGDVSAMKIMGAKLEEKGFVHESFKYYLKATMKGDEESRIKLQALYDQGIGTQSERIKAAIYLGVQKCIARIFHKK